MIVDIVRTELLNLRRDRGALLLTFVLPIAFFTVFAVVFGNMGKAGTRAVEVIVVDQDQTDMSRRLVAGLQREKSLLVRRELPAKQGLPAELYTAETAEKAVHEGKTSVAIVIPKGFSTSRFNFGPTAKSPAGAPEGSPAVKLNILQDSADAIAPQIVMGLLQKVAMTSMPDVMAEQGSVYIENMTGGLTSQQRDLFGQNLGRLRGALNSVTSANGASPAEQRGVSEGIIPVDVRDVVGANKQNPTVAFYAAGVGVLFMLFSVSGASATLLEDSESGTLDRVLATRVSMGRLLAGKYAFLTMLSTLQLTLMFVYGALFFRIELFSHLPGFMVMTIVTALAASSFGLMLAASCRSRKQLGQLSTLIILIMSSVGGTMFPRFLMPAFMQKVGLVTFNAWALDGFTKVFWRDEPVSHLWPQVVVLCGAALVFFVVARRLARRWEFS